MSFGRRVRRRLGVRRRRSVFRRRRFGRSRYSGITNRMSGASGIGNFRTRRTSRFAYRRMLWRDTVGKPHYRSILTFLPPAVSTPNNISGATLSIVTPGPTFWLAAGGAQQIDSGVPVPTFAGDVVLRGGVSSLAISNRTATTDVIASDPVRVTVYTVWTNNDPAALIFPLTVAITWDPSVIPDFPRYGKVLRRREAILKGDGECLELYYRHRIQKIDQAIYNNNGSRLQWFVLVSQTTNAETIPAPETVDLVCSHNYSFSADAT